MSKQWIPHVTVAAVVEHNQQFLMVEERINEALVINQPAGHWERDESLIEAVQRETLEETAYNVDVISLIGIYNWTIPQHKNAANTTDTFLRFTFHCKKISKTNKPLDPDIQRYLWLTEKQIHSTQYNKRSPLVIKSLNDYLTGKRYSLNQFVDIE